MYHIRRADTYEERSIHMENDVGLQYALEEASLRAKHTGVDHQIVDENGEILFLISDVMHELPGEVVKVAKPWKIDRTMFYLSAGFVAQVIWRVMGH